MINGFIKYLVWIVKRYYKPINQLIPLIFLSEEVGISILILIYSGISSWLISSEYDEIVPAFIFPWLSIFKCLIVENIYYSSSSLIKHNN